MTMQPDELALLRKSIETLRSQTETGDTDPQTLVEESARLLSLALDKLDNNQAEFEKQIENVRAELDGEILRYRELFESCPDGYLVTDRDGTVLDASGQALKLLQLDRNELKDRRFEELVHEEARPDFLACLDRVQNGQPVENWTTIVQLDDGYVITVALSVASTSSDENRVERIRWLVRDVTEQKETEAALKRSNKRFRAIYENSPMGIALVQPDAQLLDCNPALRRLLKLDNEQLKKYSLLSFIHPNQRAAVQNMLHELSAKTCSKTEMEVCYTTVDGENIWAETVATLATLAQEDSSFGIVMVDDVSEQRQMEVELVEVRKRLAEGQERERLFLAQELHDVPLQELFAAQITLTQLENETGESSQAGARLSQVQVSIKRANNMLREICNELRPPVLDNFGIQAAIEAHAQQFEETYEDIKLHLELVPDHRVLPKWMGLALFRIYQQAMSNIAQHAHAQNVYIHLEVRPDQIQLKIRDDGRGFNVPERWIQLTREGHLGIVGSAERAESIGGRYRITSAPGEGTEVTISVPLPETKVYDLDTDGA